VGGTTEIEVDVRVIAASNRPLDALVGEKRFREDLYYRLNVIPIRLPPLRERPEDIPLLADTFLRRFNREMGKTVERISPAASTRLLGYSWPGNVRELENVMERAVALETTPAVLPERLPDSLLTDPGQKDVELRDGFSLDEHLAGAEATLVLKAMQQSGGDRAKAARLLGVTGRSLRYLISKHRISADNF
jgi:two-component system response regulator PilR (NtrC family)